MKAKEISLAKERQEFQILADSEREKLKKYQSDLADEQKNLESKLVELETKFVKSFSEFESNWKNWETDDICQWLKALDDHEYDEKLKIRRNS